MKATGIVRRIDDLGRVVIPKEIRRTMRIREGDRSFVACSETCVRVIHMHKLDSCFCRILLTQHRKRFF